MSETVKFSKMVKFELRDSDDKEYWTEKKLYVKKPHHKEFVHIGTMVLQKNYWNGWIEPSGMNNNTGTTDKDPVKLAKSLANYVFYR